MQQCPFCSGDVNKNALQCKHCGEWISKEYKRYHNGTGGLVRLPTDKVPINLNKTLIYPTFFIHKNITYGLDKIKHIKHSAYNQKIAAGGSSFSSRQDEYAELLLNDGTKIKAKAAKGMFFGDKKVRNFKNALKYLLFETFQQRTTSYIDCINDKGYFLYDKTKFHIDGNIVTRKGNTINLNDYSMEFAPGILMFKKNDASAMRNVARKIVNRHPNTNFWKSILHGELTINTSVDTDVFMSLVETIYVSE